MKNEKLVYSAPSIKVSLVEDDILTWSEDESVMGPEHGNNGEELVP